MVNCKLKDVFVQVNAGALLVHGCLLVSSILLSLYLDGVVLWSLSVVFLPIWIWNVVLIAAFIVGCVVWCKKRETYRYDAEHRVHCCSMCIAFILLTVVIVGEVLIVAAGDTRRVPWRAAFTPFYLLFILSCGVCFWPVWKCRSCELEVLSIISFLQLVLLGVRLDQVSTWSWAVTLIPTWLAICALAVALVVYSIIIPLWKRKQHWLTPEGQTSKVKFPFFVVTASAALGLFTLFLILLVVRLDAQVGIPFGAVFVPLHLCILVTSANELTRDWAGNPWWFGIRQSYGEFALTKSALLQELVNVSYVKDDLLPPSTEVKAVTTSKEAGKKQEKTNLVGTLESLYMPD